MVDVLDIWDMHPVLIREPKHSWPALFHHAEGSFPRRGGVCSSPTVIGNGGGPSPRLGWFLVVRGAGGSGGEFVDSEMLSVLPGIELPRGRGRPAAAAHLDLLLGKP